MTPDEMAAYLDPNVDDPADLPPGELAWLDDVRSTLADDPGTWDGPPASLRDRVLAEAAVIEPDAPVVTDEPVSSVRRPVFDDVPVATDDGLAAVIPLRRRVRQWQAAAAAAAVVAVGLAGVTLLPDDGPAGQPFVVAGTELAPDATVTAFVDQGVAGDAITLEIAGLGPAPEGSYYAAWVISDDGVVVPVGSFHWRGGGVPIELWSGVDTARYPTFVVTLEQEGSEGMSMDAVRLRGQLSD